MGYATAAGLLTVAGWWVAVAAGVEPKEAGLALLIAWGLQTVGHAALVRRLGRGRDATRIWTAGVAARALTVLAALVASTLDAVARDVAVVYGLSLTILIILEAVWLATLGAVGPSDT